VNLPHLRYSFSLTLNRHWLAIIVGVFGVYLLIHGVVLGLAAFELWDMLHQQPPIGDFVTPETHEISSSLINGFVIFTVFGALSVAASFGIDRGSNWGRRLWIGTSAALVICVVFAIIFLDVAWTRYLFELAVVALSWWYVAALARGPLSGRGDR
jgi:hypothetical protein